MTRHMQPVPLGTDAPRGWVVTEGPMNTTQQHNPAQSNDTLGQNADLSEQVAAVLAEHRPALLDAGSWDVVAPFVREVVAHVQPSLVKRARDLMTSVGYISVWTLSEMRPLRVEVVLSAGAIEEFCEALLVGGRSVRGVATMAANLHGLREAHGIALGGVVRRAYPAASAKAPYSSAELEEIWAQVQRIPQLKRRMFCTAAVSLLVGAGAAPGECGWATPGCVIESKGRVLVGLWSPESHEASAADIDDATLATVERRWVELSGDWGGELLKAKGSACRRGERFLIGGSASRRIARLATLFAGNHGAWRVECDSGRARAAWLVEAAVSGRYANVVELMAAANMVSLDRLEDVIDFVRDGIDERGGAACALASIEEMEGRR